MAKRKAICPACGRQLIVPAKCEDCFVRCGICHHKFRLPKLSSVTDDLVATWLNMPALDDEAEDEQEEAAAAVGQPSEGAAVGSHASSGSAAGPTEESPPAPARRQEDMPSRMKRGKEVTGGSDIEVIALDPKGVVFEFPASRLMKTAFRMALPRECVRCRTRSHLSPFPVVYQANMDLSGEWSLESEYTAGQHYFSEAELKKLGDEELLERLPQVPNVPFPATLPMPYWICDMCTSEGMISGKIDPERDGGKCRLFLRNLCVAEGFLISAGGRNTPAQKKLLEQILHLKDNPWECMPNAVQNRIRKWFRPQENEAFVAYVPDRKHTRIEDGQAGLLVSDRRLIFHTSLNHREVKADEPVNLQLAMDGEKGELKVSTSHWNVTHMTVDRDGVAKLRRALWKAKFNAEWQ
ncbi:MAG: hypothetical protein ACOC93_01660 [Planctomycetota bacterium]